MLHLLLDATDGESAISWLSGLKWIAGLGGTTVIILVCVFVQKGWLVLKRELDLATARLEKMEAEKNEWKEQAMRGYELSKASQGVSLKAMGLAQGSTTGETR